MFLSYIRSNKEFENPAVVLTVLLLSIFSYSYARASIDLHNVTKETGITFKHPKFLAVLINLPIKFHIISSSNRQSSFCKVIP